MNNGRWKIRNGKEAISFMFRKRKETRSNVFPALPANATVAQKTDWICNLLASESRRSDRKTDAPFLTECADYLAQLSVEEGSLTTDEVERGLAELKERAATPCIQPEIRHRRIPLHKRVAVGLVAAVIFTFSSISLYSDYHDKYDIDDLFWMHLDEIMELEPGETIQIGTRTYYSPKSPSFSYRQEYASLIELFADEQNHFIYPATLPDGGRFDQIEKTFYSFRERGHVIFHLLSTHSRISYTAERIYDFTTRRGDFGTLYQYNGQDYYITCIETESSSLSYTAWFEDENFKYSLSAPTYELLTETISYLKGF